jgi:ABC-2 type transport system ATP-binding protein
VLVLLDEPTEGLDPVQRDDMLDLIRRIGHEFGIHVLLSSHVLDEVERVADSAVILHAGQVVSSGALSDLQATTTGGVVVEIAGDPAPFHAALTARGVTFHIQGDSTFVEGDDAMFDLVRDELARVSAPIRHLEPRRRTLEEVFLSSGLTGGQARTWARPRERQ